MVTIGERAKIISGLCASFEHIVKAVAWMNADERMYLAEEMRTAADLIDEGRGDILQHQLRRRRMVMISANGPYGRAVFKLL
jgi:hypothetical protein